MIESPEDDSYAPFPAQGTSNRHEHPDFLHEGITRFLGGRLSLAEFGNPKRILEVGAGSGAWAIHAAKQYPDAEVIAIEIYLSHGRQSSKALPKNLKLLQMDICQRLPFYDGSFDIVHFRFTLMHLPNFKDVLAQMCSLIKPGGLLICEEFDLEAYSELKRIPQAVRFFQDEMRTWTASRGETYNVGRQLFPCVSGLGMFTGITVKVFALPLSPGWDGPVEVGVLGDIMKQALLRASLILARVIPELTEDSVIGWKLALQKPEHKLRLRIYFLEARKTYKISSVQSMRNIQRKSGLIRVARCAILPLGWAGKVLVVAASWFFSLCKWR